MRASAAAVMVLVAAVMWSAGGCEAKGVVPASTAGGGEVVERVEVVDGDTVAIEDPPGHRRRVRIVGIDTPEVARDGRPAQCWADEATRALRQLLQQAGEIRLVADRAVGDRDTHGRLLRQVLVDDVDVGERMLESGHARRYRATPSASRVSGRYLERERVARTGGRGLWGRCPSGPSQFWLSTAWRVTRGRELARADDFGPGRSRCRVDGQQPQPSLSSCLCK